jgi:hypothetical protein
MRPRTCNSQATFALQRQQGSAEQAAPVGHASGCHSRRGWRVHKTNQSDSLGAVIALCLPSNARVPALLRDLRNYRDGD